MEHTNYFTNNEKEKLSSDDVDIEDYYKNVLLREQPFYRSGMSMFEAAMELEYLNNNLNSFFLGTYKPLWRQ